jgi:hypothetical protein
MSLQTDFTPPHEAAADDGSARPARVGANLPAEPVLTERAAALLRAHLRPRGLDRYHIYYCTGLDYPVVEKHLEQLGERGATWTQATPLSDGGEPVAALSVRDDSPKRREPGFLHLPRHHVVLARWHWRDHYNSLATLWLCAARGPEDVVALKQDLRRCRESSPPVWQIVRGAEYGGDDPVPRERDAGEGLIIPLPLRTRIESEIITFFSDDVLKLYRSLNVPHRRGVLLHGPPGNGKTSIIRWVGAAVPRVTALILRPHPTFDGDDLESVVDRWTSQAPGILVIEDLNWLLKKVDLSLFLNLIDGLAQSTESGLLLIATTNHPNELDPAVNNRPGRFDVVIEVPSPNHASRTEFFARMLRDVAEPTRT